MPFPHQDFAAARVMIMAAPNGARRRRSEYPALPETASQIADCAVQLADAGVSVLHLHVRDTAGAHTLDADQYRSVISAVRRAVGHRLVIQVTTEAVGRYQPAEQMAMVRDLCPEAVSLALAELCPDDSRLADAAGFFAWLVKEQIWPQYILYSVDDVRRFDALRKQGIFAHDQPDCLLVLGRYSSGLTGQVSELTAMLSAVDCNQFPWSVCCFGNNEQQAALSALDSGGHVRLGFENNVLLADGTPASDNAALINQFTAAAAKSQRTPASADEVRERIAAGRA